MAVKNLIVPLQPKHTMLTHSHSAHRLANAGRSLTSGRNLTSTHPASTEKAVHWLAKAGYASGQSWNQKLGEVCVLVRGHLLAAPFPNYIKLDTAFGELAWRDGRFHPRKLL